MLPERASEDTVISSEKDIATADIEHFTIGAAHYLAVANHCQGRNCFFDPYVVFSGGIFDLKSVIYEWQLDGTLREHQRIQTYGASDLKGFVMQDALNTGGYAPRQFLAVANYRTDNPAMAHLIGAQIWAWNETSEKFDLRQTIHTTGGFSVDVLQHDADMYIVLTNTGPQSYVTIRRWVPGSFRQDIHGSDYGWAADQDFGWVPGLFLEPIQTLKTYGAMSAVLFHPHGEIAMFLALSNYQSEGSNKVDVEIYRWREEICQKRRSIVSEHFMLRSYSVDSCPWGPNSSSFCCGRNKLSCDCQSF